MKRKLITAILVVLGVAVGLLTACDKGGDEKPEFAFESDIIWLNRYEEAPLVFALGSADGLTFSVADESIVTVGEGGLLIAQGVGETTITVKGKNTERTITVRVRKTGADPRLTVVDEYAGPEQDTFAYIGSPTEFPVKITYGDKLYEVTDWYLSSDDPAVTVNGKTVTGVSEGSAEVTVNANYKGLSLTGTFTVTVLNGSFVTLAENEIDLYLAESELRTYAVVPTRVMVDRTEKDVSEIVLSVQSGSGVSVEGNVITAAEDSGTAVVRVSAAHDAETYADISVRLHPNYIEETLIRVNANLSSAYEEYTGSDDFMAGRDGVYRYVADTSVTEEDYTAYQSASDKMAAATLTDYYSRRLEASANSDGRFATVADAYRSGYRYFAYDMYYTTRTSAHDIPELDLGILGQQMDQQITELFTRDDVSVLDADGNITNRLVTDAWITVVFDMYNRAYNSPTGAFSYYVSLRDKFGELYIDNVRYYLDDAFFAGTEEDKHIPSYKKAVTYGEKDAEGFISVSSDVFAPYFDNCVEYAPTDPQLNMDSNGDGKPAYAMVATSSLGSWNNAVVLVDSLATSYVQGALNLRSFGGKLVFDIYPVKASGIQFRLNHSLDTVTLTKDSDITDHEWIDIIDKESGKRVRKLTANRWQTVVLHYDRAERPLDGWRANIFIGIANNEGSLYLDNIRYCDNGDFIPADYDTTPEVTEVYTNTMSSTVEYVTDGLYAGTIRYTNGAYGTLSNWSTGISFAVPDDFMESGKQYIRFDFLLSATVTAGIKLQSKADNLDQTFVNITSFTDPNIGGAVPIADESGVRVYELRSGGWFTAYLPIVYDGNTESFSHYFMICGKEETGVPTAYIREIDFVTELPLTLQTVTEVRSKNANAELIYTTMDGETVIAYTNKLYHHTNTENGWNTGAYFIGQGNANPATEENGYRYLKFDLLADDNTDGFILNVGGGSGAGTYFVLSSGISGGGGGIVGSDENGNVLTGFPTEDGWQTWYVPVNPEISGVYLMVIKTADESGGWSGGYPKAYLKDIEYVTELPLALQTVTEVATSPQKSAGTTVRYVMTDGVKAIEYVNGAYDYTNGDKWNENVYFIRSDFGMSNPVTEENGYRYLKFDLKTDENVTSLLMNIAGGSNAGLQWIGTTIPAGLVCLNADGEKQTAFPATEIGTEGEWYTWYVPVSADVTEIYLMIRKAKDESGGWSGGYPKAYLKDIEYVTELPLALQTVTEVATSPQKSAGTTVRYVMTDGVKAIEYVNGAYDYTNGDKWNENVYFIRSDFGMSNPVTEENGYRYLKFDLKTDENVTSLLMNIAGGSNAGLQWIGTTIPAGLVCLNADGEKQTAFPATEIGTEGEWYTWYVPVSADVTEIYLMIRKAKDESGGWSGGYPKAYLKDIGYVTELSV